MPTVENISRHLFVFFSSEILRKLFEDLHFVVQIHVDVNSTTLENLLLTMHVLDHSKYDAFVCCILTHGKLGVVYTSDGKPVEILSLVDYFSDRQCPTLKGKPKMFFIQACQRGQNETLYRKVVVCVVYIITMATDQHVKNAADQSFMN